jgi:hypothetical protein
MKGKNLIRVIIVIFILMILLYLNYLRVEKKFIADEQEVYDSDCCEEDTCDYIVTDTLINK